MEKPPHVDARDSPMPRGFRDADQFQQFSARLRTQLPPGTEPLFQGSSVTGLGYKSSEAFDLGRQSDFDIALVGQELFERARALGLKAKDGTRIGPLTPQALEALGLAELRDQLSALAGRPVNFMLFDSMGAALKRPSMWVPGTGKEPS
jgi:filamentous hemagglutinin